NNVMLSIFFFQAEDGIRDRNVTGVQTCALPIYRGQPILAAYPHPHAHVSQTLGANLLVALFDTPGPNAGRPDGQTLHHGYRRRKIGRASCRERVEMGIIVSEDAIDDVEDTLEIK